MAKLCRVILCSYRLSGSSVYKLLFRSLDLHYIFQLEMKGSGLALEAVGKIAFQPTR